MKTITIAICTTVLILTGLFAYATRYTYTKDFGHTARTNRYTGQVCHLGYVPVTFDWNSMPLASQDTTPKNVLDDIWKPKPQPATKLVWICQ